MDPCYLFQETKKALDDMAFCSANNMEQNILNLAPEKYTFSES